MQMWNKREPCGRKPTIQMRCRVREDAGQVVACVFPRVTRQGATITKTKAAKDASAQTLEFLYFVLAEETSPNEEFQAVKEEMIGLIEEEIP